MLLIEAYPQTDEEYLIEDESILLMKKSFDANMVYIIIKMLFIIKLKKINLFTKQMILNFDNNEKFNIKHFKYFNQLTLKLLFTYIRVNKNTILIKNFNFLKVIDFFKSLYLDIVIKKDIEDYSYDNYFPLIGPKKLLNCDPLKLSTPSNYIFKKNIWELMSGTVLLKSNSLLKNNYITFLFLFKFFTIKSLKNLKKNNLITYNKNLNFYTNNINININSFKGNKNKVNLNNSDNLMYFVNIYIITFLERLLNLKVYLSIKSLDAIYSDLTFRDFLYNLVKKYKIYNFKFRSNFFINDFIEVLCITLRIKDVSFFSSWFCKTMMRFPIHLQRKYMQFLRVFFWNNIKLLLNYYNCEGFYLDVRGKLGVKGNAKRRHMCLSFGKSSVSKKTLKLLYKHNLIYTKTGVLGVTFMLSFK